MLYSSACLRAAGLAALTACLVACADTAAVTSPDAANTSALRTVVTPLSLTPRAGTSLRATIAIENHGSTAASGVSSVCLAEANTADCGPVIAQLALPSIGQSDVSIDTAVVALPLSSMFVDVPQRVRVRACTALVGSTATTCASSAVVRVMPNFEAACGTTPLVVGDSATGTGDTGRCTLSSTGERSQVFATSVRANDTLVVTLDAKGICGAGVAVFDRDGEMVAGRQICGPVGSIRIPVTFGGTYHIAIGGVPAGYALSASYAVSNVAVATSDEP
jgi:hypothetical protein